MPSLSDILADKTTFPDTMTITLADGAETTLGELRGGYLRQQDYTRKTQDLRRERDEFGRERAQFEQAKTEAEQQLASLASQVLTNQRTPQGPATPGLDDVDAILNQDPVARKLTERIAMLDTRIAELDKATKQQAELFATQQQSQLVNQHRQMLTHLKAQDADLDEAALVRFARENGIPRLDFAYKLYTEDARTERIRKEASEQASKEAYERAKRELSQPVLPSRRSAPTLPEDAPRTFEEAAERARRDPDILSTIEGFGL